MAVTKTRICSKNFKYFNLRKPNKTNDNWHIAEAIITVNTDRVRREEKIRGDEGIRVIETIAYSTERTNDTQMCHINEAMDKLNDIYNGNTMIADMDKDVEYFKKKLKEYFNAKIAEEQKKINDIRNKISIVNDI